LNSLGWEVREDTCISTLVSSIVGDFITFCVCRVGWIWIDNKSISTETTADRVSNISEEVFVI
jgi:hypothetical protein